MKIEKFKRLVAYLHDKSEYVICIWNLKQALNNGLVFYKVQRIIKINQNSWLNSYIDMNTDLRKKQIKILEKGFSKLMNNAVFRETIENAEK